MTSPILWCGSEDLSFITISSSISSSASTGQWFPSSSAGMFRAGYARYALTFYASGGGTINTAYASYLRNGIPFSSSNFWTSARLNSSSSGTTASTSTLVPMRWSDASGVIRLRIRFNATGTTPTSLFVVETLNAAGTATQIGSISTDVFSSGTGLATPDKIDVYINYSASGTFTVYRNGIQIFTYSGNILTDSATALAYVDYGHVLYQTTGYVMETAWSECIVATSNTSNMSLVTQAPSATGNTHTFTTGSYTNVNGNLVNQTSPDYSASSGQLQQYQVGQAIPSGSFSVVSVVQHGQCTVGSTGPQEISFCVRTGGSDYLSSLMNPPLGWALLQNNWDTNPNTTAPWQPTDLVNSSNAFNLGYEST